MRTKIKSKGRHPGRKFLIVLGIVLSPATLLFAIGYIHGSGPSSAQLLRYDHTEVEKRAVAALRPTMEALQHNAESYTGKLSDSIVDLCYYSATYVGFSTTGYDKICYVRVTALYPLHESSYQDAIAHFESVHHAKQVGSRVISFLEGDCTYYIMGDLGEEIRIDYYFCPAGVVPRFISFQGEPVDTSMVNQIRGPSDNADVDGIGEVNYTIVYKRPYNLQETIRLASQKSKAGYVIIGVSNEYYLKNMEQ